MIYLFCQNTSTHSYALFRTILSRQHDGRRTERQKHRAGVHAESEQDHGHQHLHQNHAGRGEQGQYKVKVILMLKRNSCVYFA